MTLLSRARARAFSFSSFSLQTLITGSRVEFIHSRASFGSPFCYIDFRRLRFYALFFSVFLRIRTYRVLLYKIWAQSVFDIFLLKNISRKISKLFDKFLCFLRRFLHTSLFFKSFARVLLSVCLHRRLRSIDYLKNDRFERKRYVYSSVLENLSGVRVARRHIWSYFFFAFWIKI
jgi:hypothetical protein